MAYVGSFAAAASVAAPAKVEAVVRWPAAGLGARLRPLEDKRRWAGRKGAAFTVRCEVPAKMGSQAAGDGSRSSSLTALELLKTSAADRMFISLFFLFLNM